VLPFLQFGRAGSAVSAASQVDDALNGTRTVVNAADDLANLAANGADDAAEVTYQIGQVLDDGLVVGTGPGTRLAGSTADAVSGGRAAPRIVIDAAQATDDEIRAAVEVSRMGRGPVVIRDPIPGRPTSDLLVNGVPYDIYTPTTANANRIISAIASKNSQASGVVLDLSRTSVTLEELGNVLARVRGAGATNIWDVIILGR
jgi:filamentous hemagglutinin